MWQCVNYITAKRLLFCDPLKVYEDVYVMSENISHIIEPRGQ